MLLVKEFIKNLRIKIIKFIFIKKGQYLQINNNSSLIIAPHPDDETFGCGGLIYRKINQKAEVYVVFLTKGEKSLENISKEEIIKVRKDSAIEALEKLGVSKQNIFWMDYLDGNIPHKNSKEFDILKNKIFELIYELNIKEVFVPHYLEGWPDHITAYEIGKETLKGTNITLFLYFVWTLYYIKLKQLKKIKWNNIYLLDLKNNFKIKNNAIKIYLNKKTSNNLLYIGNLPKVFLKIFNWKYEVYEKVEK